jgi:hypothetical protein
MFSSMKKVRLTVLATLAALGLSRNMQAADPLSSWNDTAPKKTIVAFGTPRLLVGNL